jgi:hypothetical protein
MFAHSEKEAHMPANKKIDTLNQASLRVVENTILEQAKAALADLGITLEFAGGSFADHEATLKLKVKTDDADATNEAEAKADWARHAKMYGLPEDAFGQVIRIQGKAIKLVGLKHNSPKNKVRGRYIEGARTGRECTFSVDTANYGLKAS